jgi:hypothetical protein
MDLTDKEKAAYSAMTPEQRIAWLRSHYKAAYEWLAKQSWASYDFVSVPVESLDDLMNKPN